MIRKSRLRFLLLIVVILCMPLIASENTNYGIIKEVKVWPNYIDVYSELESVCAKSGHKDRYILAKERNQTYSIVVAALASGMKVSINYECGESDVAEINGVRVKGAD